MRLVVCLALALMCVSSAQGSIFDWFGTNEPVYVSRYPPMNATVCRATEDWAVVASVVSESALDTAVQTGYYSSDGKRFRYYGLSWGGECSKSMVGTCWTVEFERWQSTTWSRCVSVGGLFVRANTPLHAVDLLPYASVGSNIFTSINSLVKCCVYRWDSMQTPELMMEPLVPFGMCEKQSRLYGSGSTFSFPFWDVLRLCPDLSTASADDLSCCAMSDETEEQARVRKISLGLNNHTFYTSIDVRRERCAAEDSFLVWSKDHELGACPLPPRIDLGATSRKSANAYWVVESVLNNMGFKDLVYNQGEFYYHFYVVILMVGIHLFLTLPVLCLSSRINGVGQFVQQVGQALDSKMDSKDKLDRERHEELLAAHRRSITPPFVGPPLTPPQVQQPQAPYYHPYEPNAVRYSGGSGDSEDDTDPDPDEDDNEGQDAPHVIGIQLGGAFNVRRATSVGSGEQAEASSLGPFIPAAESDFMNGSSDQYYGDAAEARGR